MYFFYICSLTNDCKKMKKKIMNVCGVALLAVSLLACSGQKKGAEAAESVSDTVKVATEAMSAQADSTGYIVYDYIDGWQTSDFVISSWEGCHVAVYSKLVRSMP